MRKIEKTNKQWAEILDLYWILLHDNSGFKHKFKKPEEELLSLRDEYHQNKFEFIFTQHLIDNFKQYIYMSPTDIEKRIDIIETHYKCRFYPEQEDKGESLFKQTEYGEKLLTALGYKRLQKKRLKELFNCLGVKSCIYCNAQYTLAYENEEGFAAKFQMDHYFPKKKYPYFSISLFNLVPSCANCNLNKSSRTFSLRDYCHPYRDSLSDEFKFRLSKESDKKVLLNTKFGLEDIVIIQEYSKESKFEKHNEVFDLKGIYSNFNDIAEEIFYLGKAYPKSQRKSLLKIEKDGKKLFDDEKTLERVLLRSYPDQENINERPLSKFIQDLSEISGFYS